MITVNLYISTKSVIEACNRLTLNKISDSSLLHISIILKGLGFNEIEFKDLNEITNQSAGIAFPMCSLFSPYEKLPEKYQFINPFDMNSWTQKPSEPLEKWATGRIVNNIIGGARTWKSISQHDSDYDRFKFRGNFSAKLKEICKISVGFDLLAFSIWNHRFTNFSNQVSEAELIEDICQKYQLDGKFINDIFIRASGSNILEFNDEIHDTSIIRGEIGAPSNVSSDWINTNIIEQETSNNSMYLAVANNKYQPMNRNYTSEEIYKGLIEHKQIILYGPPGTSKSFLAEELGNDFDTVRKIQFHPSYTYNEFIGGFIVDGTNVEYKLGFLLDFVEDIKNQNDQSKKFLLIIDEINRANITQVFGEVIQCLDRGYRVNLRVGKKDMEFNLPTNLYVVGTMNSSDRSVGGLDHAIRRRFLHFYCPANSSVLAGKYTFEGFSLESLLDKLNLSLFEVLRNKDLAIGHGIFLNKASWDFDSLELVFNCSILPTIEEFCSGDENKVKQILTDSLSRRLKGVTFKDAILDYIQ